MAVVTGAGSGIGAALCRALAADGAFVVAADIDERAAAAIAAEINARAASARAIDDLAIAAWPSSVGGRCDDPQARPESTVAGWVAALERRGHARAMAKQREPARAMAAEHEPVRAMAEKREGARAMANRETARATRIALTGSAIGVRCDVTEADQVDQLAGAAWVLGDGVDLWINNAGIAIGGAAHDLRREDWRRVIDVNLMGVVHGVHAIYPRMIARGVGQIINIASVAGLAPYPFALPYTTSKHAVVGLSQALRAEARVHGVRVSVACPGMIETPIWERSVVRGGLANGRGAIDRIGKLSAEACAAAILRGAAANRGVIPVTAEARAAWWLNRLSPALAGRLSSGLARIAKQLA